MANTDQMGTDQTDANEYVQMLTLGNRLIEPAVRLAIQQLQLPPGSRGLDAGCGIGDTTLWLVEALSPSGHVTGIDISPHHLALAQKAAGNTGLAGRVSFQQGDLKEVPFEDDSFDWAWGKDSLWPGPREMGFPGEDAVPLVRELARVVRPGGIVALLFWSSQKLLPGYPLLEARLNATNAANAFWNKDMDPEQHSLRTLAWLQKAGLRECEARTFVADARAPLSAETRNSLTVWFQMLWEEAEMEVSPDERTEFRRLCDPKSPDFILALSDYYAFITYSLFYGSVAV